MKNFIQRNLKVIVSSLLLLSIIGGIFLTVGDVDAAVRVKGYYRKDGTYVQPHYRSNPDGNPYNNWSFPGNINPFTGKVAPGNPDTYLKNYYNNKTGGGNITIPSPNIITPQIIVPSNATLNYFGTGWYCNDGYKQVGNSCELVVCGANQTRYGTSCYCKDGYKMNYTTNQCELVICGANQYRWGTSCYCKDGYKMNYTTNQCELVVCGPNQYRWGTNCYCNDGYKMNYTTNKCELVICGSNQYRWGINCYCNDGYKMNYNTNQCELK